MAPTPPLRIFIFSTSFPRWEGDDAGVFVQRLVAALGKQGTDVTVFVPRDGEEAPTEKRDEYSVARFRYSMRSGKLAFGAGIMPNIRRNPKVLLQAPGLLGGFVVAALRRASCHVVHANWLVTSIPACMYGVLKGVPFVVTARGEDINLLQRRAARRLLSLPLSRSAAVVAVSNSVAEQLRELLPSLSHKISVVPNGVEVKRPTERELQQARVDYSLGKGVHYITFVGSVIPRKRIELVIRAIHELNRSDVELLVLGRLDDRSYVDSLKKLTSDLGVSESVRFTGPIAPEEVGNILALSSVYISASASEGRPNAVLEAMAAGLPVVASDIPAHREIVTDKESGFICSTEHEMAHAIRTVLDSTALREAMGEKARRSVEHFSWRRSAQAYRDLFASIHRSSSNVEIDVPQKHSKPH